jgi:hypothetical protein
MLLSIFLWCIHMTIDSLRMPESMPGGLACTMTLLARSIRQWLGIYSVYSQNIFYFVF